MEEKDIVSNEQVLDWIYYKWRELGNHLVNGREYIIRRKAYESMMWELKELMSEESFNKIWLKHKK